MKTRIDLKMVSLIIDSGKLSENEASFWRGYLAAKENLPDEAIALLLEKLYPKCSK